MATPCPMTTITELKKKKKKTEKRIIAPLLALQSSPERALISFGSEAHP